jgi:glycosyltransferase involved in cell wall biosynthesis
MIVSGVPKVSVCIPVYNGGVYIAEAIESVLAQTYKGFQLIICDNCSTDNTEHIVRSFRDSRVTYVRNSENLGLVGNANRCLELADGEYVCIFHHDDVMLPGNLERKIRILDENPEVGFVHSNLFLINSKGETVASDIWNEDSRKDYIDKGIDVFYRFVSSIHYGSSIFIGAVLARKKCYEHLGGFNPKFPHCNDSEMWMRMLLFYGVACIGIPLVKYRVHPSSGSSSWGDYNSIVYVKEHYQAVKMIFKKYKNRIPQRNKLKKQVALLFAERLMNLSLQSLIRGDFAQGRAFAKEAIIISPFVLNNKVFWKTAIKLSLGSNGMEIYRKGGRLLQRN